MPIPGYSQVESGSSWQSTVPGWVRPAVNVDVDPPPLRVTLEGLTLQTDRQSPREWRDLIALDGWWEGPEIRADEMPIPGRDGEHEGQVLFGARPISVRGAIYMPTRERLIREMSRYASVLAGRTRYGVLTVEESELGLSRQCRVRLAQPTVVVPDGDRYASVLWSLRAADPVRYEATPRYLTLQIGRTADGIIENVGNAGVPLTVQLFGPMTKPSVWIDGVKWTLDYTIAAGASVIAYFNDREVWSGSSSLRYFQSGPWPPMKPGVTPIGISAASTTGSARFSWRSGWL